MSWLLTRNVQIPQQALFARQDIYTGEEPLQSLEVSIAFRRDQFLFPFLPCVIPLLRDCGKNRFGRSDSVVLRNYAASHSQGS